MTTYRVYPKGSTVLAYEYSADAPVEWNEYPFASFDHVAQPAPPLPAGGMYGGRRKLTKLEWRKLLLASEEEAFDEIRANVETMTLPDGVPRSKVRTYVHRYEEATLMDLDDSDQAAGFGLLVALGKMDPSRIQVILNG